MNISKDKLHHAYIIEGSSEIIYPKICDFCHNELELEIQSNPDFVYEQSDKFLIENARRLREMQANKTAGNGLQIFVISFNFITREAQNALLKVLEEPSSRTHFFIITPSSHVFLDTVLSRVVLINDYKHEIPESEAKKFLKSSYADRINIITKMIKNIKDKKISKFDAINMLRELKSLIYQESKSKKDYKKFHILREIQEAEDYLHDNSASVKILLENIALKV